MISRISKMLVMMALPIVLIACGEKTGVTAKDSGMRFVPVEGQTLPGEVVAETNNLSFGQFNFVGVEKGPIRYSLTNITGNPVKFVKAGLVGGNDDVFITGSSCLETLAANDSCEVTVTLSPKEQLKTYRDEYSVEFTFGSETAIPVQLALSARTFTGQLEDTGIEGLSVSADYQDIKFDNVSLGNTSSPEVVQYFYFGDSEVIVNATEAVVASSNEASGSIISGSDREVSIESACGLLRYGDSCSIQLFYKPAVPSNEIEPVGYIYSHLPVKISKGDEKALSTIMMKKESHIPEGSDLMVFTESDDTDISSFIQLADTEAGRLSTTTTKLKLKRTDVSPDITEMFYRLESTNPAIQINRGACDLVLDNTENGVDLCEFNVNFSPSDAGAHVGYLMAVAGNERIYLSVKGNASGTTDREIFTDAGTNVSVNEVVLQAEKNILSATKRIKVEFGTSTGTGLPFSIELSGGTDNVRQQFNYTTTCADAEALSTDNPICYIDVNFRGSATAGDTPTGVVLRFVDPTNGTTGMTIPLTGTTVEALVDISKVTPVEDLEINAKSFAYPTTGIGLVSPTFLITLTNNGDVGISGLGTTSTDLATFTLNNDIDQACVSTLGTGTSNTCTLGYVFRPRNSLEKTGYISIFDNRTATGLRNNEIIQVVGRGTLFNEYLSFGVVAPNETKTLVASLTNDGITPLVIKSVVAEEFKSEWKTEGFVAVKDQPKGNRVALINKYFNRDNFTNMVTDTNQTIKIISSECNGISLDPGASCLMRLEFKPTRPVTTEVGKEHENHYRAYLNVKHANGSIIDRLHVIGSTQDNSTMYMYPEQDFNQALETKPTTGFEKDNNVSTTTLERNFVVIGNDVYSYLGSSHRSNEGSLFKGDNKLRKYDASRNKWVILNPAGENPFNKVIGNSGAGQYDLAMQSKLIAYDGKLYLYPLGFNGHGPSYRYDLYVYDPNIGVDGTWTNLGPAPDSNQHTYISMSAYKGKIYFFGGNSEKNRSEVTEYDIDKNTYRTLTAKGTKPRERNGPALIVSEIVRKSGTKNLTIPYLIVHGGAGMENSAAPVHGKFFYGLNDLWAFELPRYDEEGKKVIRDETYTWTELQKNTPRLVAGTETPSTNESATNVESDLRHIENRPADRGVHVFNYYDNKLFLTSGRDGTDDPHGGTHNGEKGLLYTLDPAKLFNNDDENTTCSTVSIGTDGSQEPTNTICDAFSVYTQLKTDYLNFNLSETLSGDLWFHNWNILGVFFNKALEDGATK